MEIVKFDRGRIQAYFSLQTAAGAGISVASAPGKRRDICFSAVTVTVSVIMHHPKQESAVCTQHKRRISLHAKRVRKCIPFHRMRMSGLEPMTPCMSSRYSNQLSYTLTTDTIIAQFFGFVNPFLKICPKKFIPLLHGTPQSLQETHPRIYPAYICRCRRSQASPLCPSDAYCTYPAALHPKK